MEDMRNALNKLEQLTLAEAALSTVAVAGLARVVSPELRKACIEERDAIRQRISRIRGDVEAMVPPPAAAIRISRGGQ